MASDACPQQPILAPDEAFPNSPGLSGVAQSMLQRTIGLLVLYEMPFAHKKHVGLYLNVVRPASVSEGADLPVIVVSWLSVIFEDNKILLLPERSGYTAIIFQNRHWVRSSFKFKH